MRYFTVNGVKQPLPERKTLLQALQAVGAPVPHLCHDERLKPLGGCRLCLVEIQGCSRAVASCNVAATDGMVVKTTTPALEDFRRTQLKMMAHHYPRDAFENDPDLPFHRLLRDYGLTSSVRGVSDPLLVDESHPHIRVDMSRCIECTRCVRICAEVQGQFVWEPAGRGENGRVVPGAAENLAASACVSCGACADTCPTGAIEDRALAFQRQPERWVPTTCCYCGTGCSLEVGVRDGAVVAARPVTNAAVNRGHLCVKGRYALGFATAPDRVTRPMIRMNGAWREVSWNEALSFTTEKMRDITLRYGPNALGFLGSARATNEENYLMQKFARVVIGTNNVDCCARVCHTPSAAALKIMLGTGAATNSFDDIEKARTILVCGSNTTENHPIVGARIKQAALSGARLIVIDPRITELAAMADLHLRPKPGTNVWLFNAMANVVVHEGLADSDFIGRRVAEWDEFRAFITDYPPEKAASVCGVPANDIRRAARLYAEVKPAICFHGLGLTEHVQGTEGVMTLVNLALITGNIGKHGTGINPLRGQNNVQGSAMMGCDPGNYAGLAPVKSPEVRAKFSAAWGAPLPSERGLNLLEMFDAAAAGNLKALWVCGYDVYLTLPDEERTRRSLSNLELVIVQDLFLNETAKAFGTVFLPAASSFEKDGTFMNSDRRVQRVRRALPPAGDARPDWEIIRDLARRMGHGSAFEYDNPQAIWDEIRSLWPAGAGLSYARMDGEVPQWPCPSEEHPGTPVLHVESFPIGERAALKRIGFTATPETVDAEFPLLLNTGRNLYHFNAGTMTFRGGNEKLVPSDFLDVSPTDAAQLGLKNRDEAVIRSHYGETVLPVRVSETVNPGEVFATFHDPRSFLNRVTGPLRDGIVLTPEYKVTAVMVQKAQKG